MYKFFFILFTLVASGSGFGQGIDSLDYQVYSILINKTKGDSRKPVVVINRMTRNEYVSLFPESQKEDWENTWMQYFRVPFDTVAFKLIQTFSSKEPSLLLFDNNFQVRGPVFMINERHFKSMFRKSVDKGWKTFYKYHPNAEGVFTFSDVGYSADKKSAVVYYAIRRNGLNGRGALAVLQLGEEGWTVKYDASLWHN